MGYSMDTDGAVVLPADVEPAALEAVAGAMSRLQGWYPDDDTEVTTLDDLARFVGAALKRRGDRVRFATDEEGDPKWSDQATAFYLALAPYVSSGAVRFRGEDGLTWSYRYDGGAVQQEGINGWDGSSEPFGPPADLSTEPPPELPTRPQVRPSIGRVQPRARQSTDTQQPTQWLGLSPTAIGLLIGLTVLMILLLSL